MIFVVDLYFLKFVVLINLVLLQSMEQKGVNNVIVNENNVNEAFADLRMLSHPPHDVLCLAEHVSSIGAWPARVEVGGLEIYVVVLRICRKVR